MITQQTPTAITTTTTTNMDSSNQSVKRSSDLQDGDWRGGGLDYLQLDSEQRNKARQSLLQAASSMESQFASYNMQQSTAFALLLNQLQQQPQQKSPNNNGLDLQYNPQALFGAPQQQHQQATAQPVDPTRNSLQAVGLQKHMGMDRQNSAAVIRLVVQAAQKQLQQQMNYMPRLHSQPSVPQLTGRQQPQQQSISQRNPAPVSSFLASLKSRSDLTAGGSQSLAASSQIQEKAEPKERTATPPLRKRRRIVTSRVEKPKPDRKKPSKVPTTVPCRCRGMPNDHTPKTAFIAIPKNVSHGQALKCSHPICQKRGVRFRFCEVCQIPVAKRNFSTRHNHPPGAFPEAKELEVNEAQDEEALETKTKVELAEEEGDVDIDDKEEATASMKRPQDIERCSIASLISAAVSVTKETCEDCSSSATTNDEPEEKHQKKSKNKRLMARAYQTPMDLPDLDKFGTERCMEWLTMLGQRPPPNRPEEMTRWLDQLMVVSDLSQALKIIDADQDTMISDMADESSSDGTVRSTSSGDVS